MAEAKRRWGDDRSILNEEEARRRLLDAASTCIIRRGDAQVNMGEVADEARVARSTLYRYFSNRNELIVGLLIERLDVALERVVRELPEPQSAAQSLPDLVLEPIGLVEGNPLNEALFSQESSGLVTWIELNSESLFEVAYRHFGPLLNLWQTNGQLHQDLDLHEVVRWIAAVSNILLAPPWRHRSKQAKRRFLEDFVMRALLSAPFEAVPT